MWYECFIYQKQNKNSYSDHINYINNKIAKSIGIINKTRNFLSTYTLTNLYYTFIYPYLIYCTEIWGNTNDIHLDPLIKIQKKFKSNHILSSSRLYSSSFSKAEYTKF